MSGSHGVKVVIIHTQYLQTDPASFKSVVQKLTGKRLEGVPFASQLRDEKGSQRNEVLRNLSFERLDRLMKEMPMMEEMDDSIWTGQ